MNKRQIKSLQKRVHKHAKEECASHTGDDGCHTTIDGKCRLSYQADRVCGNVCQYYMKSVGPGAGVLFEEYLEQFPDGYPLKPNKKEFPDKCERCQQRFKKLSNRQKYCERCKSEVEREQARLRMKKKRLKDALKTRDTVTI